MQVTTRVESRDLAISESRHTRDGLSNLLPSSYRWAKRVRQGDVIPARVYPLVPLGVSFHHLIQGVVILLNEVIEI